MIEIELALYFFGSGLFGGLIQAWRHPKYDTPVVFTGVVLGPLALLVVILNWKREPWEIEEVCNTRASGWISVDDRFPEDGQEFLAYDGNITYAVRYGESIEDTVMAGCGFKIEPTHWMPLPESPKEKEDGCR